MTRVAVWAAVSSRAQVENKDSLASQLRDGRLWADQVEGQVTHTFEIPGHSRQYIFFHDAAAVIPAYDELRQACEGREFDVLWCRSRDRLGRTDALIAQVEALVANAGAAVYSALMPSPIEDTSTASSIYMSAIERAQSEVETIQRVRRVRIGHKARVRSGLPHGGPLPYGYTAHRDEKGRVTRLVIDEQTAGAIHLITERYIDGWGMRRIVQALNASPYRAPASDTWTRRTVSRLLQNSTYAGFAHYGELEVKSDKIEPYWDAPTYRAILREQASRRHGGSEIATALSGICFCTRCGRQMGHHASGYHAYYGCAKHIEKSFTREACHPNNTRVATIAQKLDAFLSPALAGDVDVDALLEQATPDLSRLQQERERLRTEMESTRGKRKRLALALAEGTMEAGPYRQADDQLVEDLDRTLAGIHTIDQRLLTQPTAGERREAIEELRHYWQEGDTDWLLREDCKHEIQALLRRLGIRIYCEENAVTAILLSA